MSAKKRKQQFRRRHQKANWRRLLIIGVGLLALFTLATFVFRPPPEAEAVSPDRLTDDPSLGPVDAPVTIIEYGDFGCPSCLA